MSKQNGLTPILSTTELWSTHGPEIREITKDISKMTKVPDALINVCPLLAKVFRDQVKSPRATAEVVELRDYCMNVLYTLQSKDLVDLSQYTFGRHLLHTCLIIVLTSSIQVQDQLGSRALHLAKLILTASRDYRRHVVHTMSVGMLKEFQHELTPHIGLDRPLDQSNFIIKLPLQERKDLYEMLCGIIDMLFNEYHLIDEERCLNGEKMLSIPKPESSQSTITTSTNKQRERRNSTVGKKKKKSRKKSHHKFH
eukprot:TRINITY_DN778_c2_g1_i1.p1 TRINITY_DN778_c2_g1~~TRINITY_DN778_c2_g1_i1.p1  ORF type:complete len:254 (-),score=38.67 TRINITY_DN778_c2_g1_i1:157-918(-)